MKIDINVYSDCIIMTTEGHEVQLEKINGFDCPTAVKISYDGKIGEILESPDLGYIVHLAYKTARDWLRSEEHWDRISWARRRQEYIWMIKKA